MRNIIKYLGIALVIVGILLVMKNLFTKEPTWKENNNTTKETSYTARIKLLDKSTGDYVSGAKMILKDKEGKIVAEWTTENKVYLVTKLEKGKYTLSQKEAPKYYHLNKDEYTFEIKNSNKNITMYNEKMTESEIKEANTTKTEVGVDNTSSSKSILTIILSIITTTLGLSYIYKTKKNY